MSITLRPFVPKAEQNAKDEAPVKSAKENLLVPLAKTFADLLRTPLQPRKRILGNWLFQGDLGAIVASRGSGKTWVTMLIAKAISTAAPMGTWDGPDEPLRVGIFDSEMAPEDLHGRAQACGLDGLESLLLLSYSDILQARRRPLNLADADDHELLLGWAREAKLDVLIVDNITTATSGISENDNSDFRDKIQPLFLGARAMGLTFITVGHAGRNGCWRGASAKEDLLDWTLLLARDDESEDDKLVLKSSFGKFRRSRDGNPPLKWTISAQAGEPIQVHSESYSGPDAMLSMVGAGIGQPSQLAEELGVSGGTISKWAKKLIDSGRLKKTGRSEYALNT